MTAYLEGFWEAAYGRRSTIPDDPAGAADWHAGQEAGAVALDQEAADLELARDWGLLPVPTHKDP